MYNVEEVILFFHDHNYIYYVIELVTRTLPSRVKALSAYCTTLRNLGPNWQVPVSLREYQRIFPKTA